MLAPRKKLVKNKNLLEKVLPKKNCLQNKCLPQKKTCPFISHPPSILQMTPPKDPFLDAHLTLVTTPEALGKHWRTCNYCKKLFKGFKAPSWGRAHLGVFDHAGVVACAETPEVLRKELLAAQTKEVEQKQKKLERKAERKRIYKEERDEAEAQKAQKQSKVIDWKHDLRKSLNRQAGRAFYPGDYPRGPGQALAHLQLLQKTI